MSAITAVFKSGSLTGVAERKRFEWWFEKEFSWLKADEQLKGRMWKAWQARARQA